MLPTACQIALKEWAVTVKALDEGEQILLLRKGGIREEGKDFRVLYPEFLLYPTYEHQKEDLLKKGHHKHLQQVLSQAPKQDPIPLTHWAKVEEVIELSAQEEVDTLLPYHVWTQDYAQKRLHWKPRHPLSIMLLRVYRLEEARSVPYLPEYGGCKSWVQFSEEVPLGGLAPVLSEDQFRGSVDQVKEVLGVPV